MMTARTHVDSAARSQMIASSPRGTFSQAELAGNRVPHCHAGRPTAARRAQTTRLGLSPRTARPVGGPRPGVVTFWAERLA